MGSATTPIPNSHLIVIWKATINIWTYNQPKGIDSTNVLAFKSFQTYSYTTRQRKSRPILIKKNYDIVNIKDIVNKYITHSIKTLNVGKMSWELPSFLQIPK